MSKKEKISQEELDQYLRNGEEIFENLNLRGLDFGYYKISQKTFINCDLTAANFITNDLHNNTIEDCEFTNCDISHAHFRNVMKCDFKDCYGFQPDFQNSEITETDFTTCDFEKADFRKSNMLDTSFNHSTIKSSNFRESELFTVNVINNTQIYGSYFDKSKIENTIFDDVMIYGSSINYPEIKGSSFYGNKIVESNLTGANIQDTVFRKCEMVTTDLNNSKFTKCEFPYSYFANTVKGLKTCEFNECLYSPTKWREDTRIEDLRKELIKEKDFYNAYVLTELNDAIPTSDLSTQFMKDVVKKHGTDGNILQKALENVGVRDGLSDKEMAELFNKTLSSNEYKTAFEKEKSKSVENAR